MRVLRILLRLLLPGLRLKRWLLVNFAGMMLFAAGCWVLAPATEADRLRSLWLGQWGPATQNVNAPVLLLGAAFMLLGVLLAALGTQHLIRAFTNITHPHASGRQLIRDLLAQHDTAPRLRIVGLGGGTGLSTLLRGLKVYPVDLTAIVTVADDGGSSGRLRADLAMPPPGDIRNCLVALAETEPMMEAIFQHRFAGGASALQGHSLGNLMIAGLSEMTGDFLEAIQLASRVLAVRGRVIPSAHGALELIATTMDGEVIRGETAISHLQRPIASMRIDPPETTPLPEALEAIREADLIIVGPGSVYSSLLPNLIIPGMAEALLASPAIKIFVCNVMTQPGESDAFSASRHLLAVLEQLPCANPFQYAVINLQRPAPEVMSVYAAQHQQFVDPDLARVHALGVVPITGALLDDLPLARHNPDKLARCILEKIAGTPSWRHLLRKKT